MRLTNVHYAKVISHGVQAHSSKQSFRQDYPASSRRSSRQKGENSCGAWPTTDPSFTTPTVCVTAFVIHSLTGELLSQYCLLDVLTIFTLTIAYLLIRSSSELALLFYEVDGPAFSA